MRHLEKDLCNMGNNSTLTATLVQRNSTVTMDNLFGKCMPLQVYGNAMSPTYRSGDVVALQELKGRNPIIIPGETYLIVTNSDYDDLKLLRRVISHDNENKLLLRAENADYGDILIDIEAVAAMFLVRGAVRVNSL